MDREYQLLEIEIIEFESEDIIITSPGFDENTGPKVP